MQETATNALRAGIVVVIAAVVAVAFFLASRKNTLDDKNSVPYFALLTDASGINAKSLITVAGLQVGEIKNIQLVEVTRRELGQVEKAEPGQPAVLAVDLDERVRVARVDMRINKDVQIPDDTWLKKESLGLLGAKALFLEPGRSTTLVAANGRIQNVRSVTATDALLAQAEHIVTDVRSITRKLDEDIGGITHDIKGITGELNRFVTGDADHPPLDEVYAMVMGDLRKLSNTVERAVRDVNGTIKNNDQNITRLVANLTQISNDIADLTGTGGGGGRPATAIAGSGGEPSTGGAVPAPGGPAVNPEGLPTGGQPLGQGDLRATVASIRKISDDLSVVTGQLRTAFADTNGDMGQTVSQIHTTLDELNKSLASLSDVAGRVARGEGTVGRLLTDEKMADKVEQAVNGASDYVTTLTSMEAHVDVGTWYNVNRGGATAALSLRLQPKPDKFYLVEIVDDGGGIERLTQASSPTAGSLRTTEYREDHSIRFTAMFAKRFFDFLAFRAGLIETTGGVGANIYLFNERVELRTDLFDFAKPRNAVVGDLYPFLLPRWRTMIKAQPIPFIYVVAGVDDVLNSVDKFGLQSYAASRGYGFDYFFGAGLTFKDDDLRAILPFIPAF